MTHKPIIFQQISFVLPHKTCFSDVSETIHYGQRIAIIGKNGAGKSSFLRMLMKDIEPSSGSFLIPSDVHVGFVPQISSDDDLLSGGEQFNRRLSQALALSPNVLILDEPTNHLDRKNRTSLLRMLQKFPHTLIVASHDEELLHTRFDRIIAFKDGGKVDIFSGSYEDYLVYSRQTILAIEKDAASLNKEIAKNHQALMQEQQRAKKSRLKGQKNIDNKKWPTMVSHAKARRAEMTAGNKKLMIRDKKSDLVDKLSELHRVEKIVPKFHFPSNATKSGTLLAIFDGAVGFSDDKPILSDINLSISFGERIAIIGDNGSGKSTLFKAIMDVETVHKRGIWHLPHREDIGYLDQHYKNLDENLTPFEIIATRRPDWQLKDVREHLNEFLFRKNEEVHAKVGALSGGERLRLSLCQIAAKAPRMLLLDEVTNNVDRETKEHVVTVLSAFPGALMMISHDDAFLQKVGIEKVHNISKEFPPLRGA